MMPLNGVYQKKHKRSYQQLVFVTNRIIAVIALFPLLNFFNCALWKMLLVNNSLLPVLVMALKMSSYVWIITINSYRQAENVRNLRKKTI